MRVLVAEDHEGVHDLVTQLIDEEQGLEVVGEAWTGQEVLHLAETLTPDAIVLDLGMPLIDGEHALEVLRKQLPAARIVVLSGQASAIAAPRLKRLGADALVEKGVRDWEATLIAALRDA